MRLKHKCCVCLQWYTAPRDESAHDPICPECRAQGWTAKPPPVPIKGNRPDRRVVVRGTVGGCAKHMGMERR